MTHHVAVFGAGVAGLTAAHELISAGDDVEVTLYERNPVVGGKARSFPKPDSASDGGKPLPGEHGFRFFPGYYRHVIDTMARIPYDAGSKGATVAGNLVPAPETHFARTTGDVVQMPNRFPTNVHELAEVFTFGGAVDIPMNDALRFAKQLLKLFCACDERRLGEFESMSWFEFVEGEQCCDDYRKYLADGLNQRTVAASGRDVSARTVGLTLIRIMRDWMHPGTVIDRLLNGPTSDRWIEPWRKNLKDLGVRFKLGTTLRELHWTPELGVTGATIKGPKGATSKVVADAYVVALPLDDARDVAERSKLIGAGVGLDGLPELSADWMNGIQFYLDGVLDLAEGHTIYVDSEFSLTSVSQRQFWSEVEFEKLGDGEVKAILSVDISDWEKPCTCHGKRAKDMTRAQIKDEVLRQVTEHVEVAYGVSMPDVIDWFLDPAIVERSSSRARPRTQNKEALFINRVGSWWSRPEATTGVANLFLASDYVRTTTDLATMEGANEAGRLASRGVLTHLGQDARALRIKLFEFPEPLAFKPFRVKDDLLYKAPPPPPPPLPVSGPGDNTPVMTPLPLTDGPPDMGVLPDTWELDPVD